jgi:mono/diheme cytochrome c family protein
VNRLIGIAAAVGVPASGLLASAAIGDASPPTFSKDVAPILFKNCANCHRTGAVAASVPLLSYETAKSRAAAIKEKILTREMPPWPADPEGSVKFRNDARLSRQDIDTLVAWVNSGAAKGNDADLPPMPTFAQGWLHPQGLAPDAVVTLPEYTVPATGEVPYIQQLMKVPYSEDKWIVAMQVRADNRALLHHMGITEVRLPDGLRPEDLNAFATAARQFGFPNGALETTQGAVADPMNPEAYDMLGVYTPGTTFERYEDGSARLLKGGKNLYINFNIHYTTTGKPESDRSQLALWFQSAPPKHQLFRAPAAVSTIIANGRELLTDDPGTKAEGTDVAIPPIPPYAENYELVGVTAYTEPVTIYQFQPHAHVRAKDFRYTVFYPNGREETVLTVPKYDFHWQLAYELETPLDLPAGSKLIVTAHYDNSLKNEHLRQNGTGDSARNCGPDKVAYFRKQNQSWDEMFSPLVQYSVDNSEPTPPAKGVLSPQPASENPTPIRAVKQGYRNALEIVEAVGCLGQSQSAVWMLTHAGNPLATKTQSTSLSATAAASAMPLGNRRYRLLGATVFNPRGSAGKKVVVKGVLIRDATGTRLNVTSLQTAAERCDGPPAADAIAHGIGATTAPTATHLAHAQQP